MNPETTTPRGKEDSKGVKDTAIEIFNAVKTTYQSAWSRDTDEQKWIHSIEKAVSLIAPAAVLWSAIDTCKTFSDDDRFNEYFYVCLVLLPAILFVFACHILKKYDKDKAPLLAFSVLLFVSGAVFTSNELIDHVNQSNGNSGNNPPWGDLLLAFSAFCVLVEEFCLVGFNDKMNEKIKRIKQLENTATENAKIVGDLTSTAQEKHEELTRLHENANTLYRNMSRQSREWNESRQAVLLKACGVVAIIVLAFTSMCGIN